MILGIMILGIMTISITTNHLLKCLLSVLTVQQNVITQNVVEPDIAALSTNPPRFSSPKQNFSFFGVSQTKIFTAVINFVLLTHKLECLSPENYFRTV